MGRKIDYYAAKAIRGNDEIIFCAFDTETVPPDGSKVFDEALGGELACITYGTPYKDIIYDCKDGMVDRFFEYISQYPQPCVWYCHNAQYDWRYFMDHLIESKLNAEIGMRTDNDVYEIKFKNKDGRWVVMRDSYALFNSSLKKMAASFCPELPKGDVDFGNEIFNPTDERHISYAVRDTQILLTGLPRLAALLNKHFGINPNATFASTSLKGWQKTLPEGTIFNASKWGEEEAFIRQSYYGGIVFPTDTNPHNNCVTYDINSSYPYAMMKYGVPYGRTKKVREFVSDCMGVYSVRVRSPSNLVVPILPARDDRGNMRWYRGEFDTVCTDRELTFAARYGYEILAIYEGIVWEETVYPFSDYINKCMGIRKQFHIPAEQGISPEEYLAKFMQNSLYGKFGSRRERRRLIPTHLLTDDERMETVPFGPDEKWSYRVELDEGMRCMPTWAVFITAHARLRLLEAVYTVGVDNVLYGDTDSITMKAGPHEALIDCGDEYGQFKKEKEWETFRCIAPKVYSGILKSGKRIGAAKGLPKKNLTEQHWKELLEDGKTSAKALSLDSLRLTLKNGVKPAHMLLRKSSNLDNSVNYEKLPDGRVRAKMKA